ncbi:DUF4304 domain-containing protein [Mucilaginibacter polytrichastri]|uniref:DUF4304 domain-containing protein n=1 Tax=Mucilaginibacter polytrichastri TaxID=1302689 RepID=A0A1Q6A0T4_9SPHI|nr:DUF4304 domain-containing protein [Mucilaginibacter polytrichastri]OKS87608.1 hypothetical protein RG47T_3069 [Mucilaginibacter polytrichastri]SFS92760.1 protein of unknown function [Mucilaginibacter polytrichastri]
MDRDLNEEFKTLVKIGVAPKLKELGFKKSNFNFNRPLDELVQCINIQRSQWNHNESVSFTFNIGFYNEKIYRLLRNHIKLSNFIKVTDCFIWGRSGSLIYNRDHWYELNLEKSYSDVFSEVINDLENYIIPLFEKYSKLNTLTHFLVAKYEDQTFHISANEIVVFELQFGDFQKGRTLLIDIYKQALIPKSGMQKTIYPDGREEIKWSEPSVNNFNIQMLEQLAEHYEINLQG